MSVSIQMPLDKKHLPEQLECNAKNGAAYQCKFNLKLHQFNLNISSHSLKRNVVLLVDVDLTQLVFSYARKNHFIISTKQIR